MKRVKKIGAGISFPVQLLAWVDKQQTMEKNRSDVVVEYLQSCMDGRSYSLDDMALPILKKMLKFFVSNKPTKTQLSRFRAMFLLEESDYIETIFKELI